MYVNIFRGTATRSVGELVREQKERRVHSKLNREKKSGHVKKNHQGLYTFLLDSRQISPLIFFFFFPPPLSSSPARYILFLFHTGGLHARNIRPRLTCMLLARDLTLVHHPTFVCTSRHLLFSLLFYAACRVK